MNISRFFSVIIIILFLNLLLGGVATQYVVEFWGTWFKGVPVQVPLFPCMVVGLFLGEFTIPLAAFTWLFSFVL